jgi:ribonuclease BN (tRNA processing enzyme)
MRLTVLGGCGAWPEAGRACSGYLIEQDGFRLLVDPGYATLPRLLEVSPAEQVDAVFVSHGHPDHCADLNPLLRARSLGAGDPPALTVHTLPGALDQVLALDRPGLLDDAYRLSEFEAGATFEIGPFMTRTSLLPHWVPNAGVRLSAAGRVLTYTGDCGPSPALVDLARDADLLLAEATHLHPVPADSGEYQTSARLAGRQAQQAGVERLLLTHLWPGTDQAAVVAEAGEEFAGPIDVAVTGLVAELP